LKADKVFDYAMYAHSLGRMFAFSPPAAG